MLTRRLALLGTTASLAALPALAQPRRAPAAPRAGAHGRGKDPVPTGSPADTPLGPVDTVAKWAFAVDFVTGATLLDKNADEEMPPSSMTKLMTIYIVYERLKSGRLKLDDELPVSERAWRMGGSKMFVQVGTQVKVEDLIRGVIVQSGNDACLVLAEAIAGSEEQFVELMNQTAKQLGLTHSFFKNCTGWPDPEQHMSCRDIATLARRIIMDFPEYYHYDSEKTFKYNGIEQGNRNPMVQKGTADGLKTGHTEAGGYGLVVSSMRNGRRIILVLNGMTSMRERAEESERLMDWCFANFEDVTLFAAGDVVENVKVWLGTQPTVPLVGGRDLVVTMPRNWRKNASIKVTYDSPIRAPVAKGDALGKLTVSGQGVPSMDVPLLAGADVPKLGLPGRAMAVLSHYVTGG
ncbi:MAG: D-alanyl-D-alanine carboxypeptidase [Rhodospirillales bacterium 69-11]|nr:D-alanyl-D-alanine carboxypeptidase [Rhodospirillales bacterium]OJW25120.1 MAG: D-alanyl-D-alanine carboxypeptidase [Rhodospirillales bacterium 69-11]